MAEEASDKKYRRVKVYLRGQYVKTITVPVGTGNRARVVLTKNTTVKKCSYLGPSLRVVKNELCGCAGRYEKVHKCLHFDKDTTTTQYRHNQPELCCIGCPVGPFSAEF